LTDLLTPLKTQLRDLSSRFALPTPPPDLAAKEAAYLLGCGGLSGRIRELAEKRASEIVKEESVIAPLLFLQINFAFSVIFQVFRFFGVRAAILFILTLHAELLNHNKAVLE
jgi:hypothetical protein